MSYDSFANAVPTMTYEEQVNLLSVLIDAVKKGIHSNSEKNNVSRKIDSRMEALKSVSGICTGLLDGVDALDFQNQLREDRVIG